METPVGNTTLRMLGSRLSDLLDEDQWKECEELILEINQFIKKYSWHTVECPDHVIERGKCNCDFRT